MDSSVLSAVHQIRATLKDQVSWVRQAGSVAFVEGTLDEIDQAKAQLAGLYECLSAMDLIEQTLSVPVPEVAKEVGAEPEVLAPEQDPEPEPEPVRVDLPQPEPEVAPEPIPEPEVRSNPLPKVTQRFTKADKKRFEDQVRQFNQEMRELPESVSPWLSRRMICWVRGLMRQSERYDSSYPFLDAALDDLAELHNRCTDTATFFGLNGNRVLSEQAWMDFKLGYEVGEVAEQWAAAATLPLDEDTGKLFECARGVRDFLEQLAQEHIQGPDSVIKGLRDQLKRLGSPTSPPLPADHAKAMDRLRSQTNDFALLHRRHVELRDKKMRRDEAFARLEAFLENLDPAFDLGDRLAELAEDCLAAGVPPSHKTLRGHLVPYRALLAEPEQPALKKLVDFLVRDEAAAEVEATLVEARDEPDPDHERRVQDLRQLLEGKRLFLVGGNKGQQKRVPDLERLLGVSIDWPDAEEDTKLSRLMPSVKKADVVAQLIRFSRHSYGEVLRAAVSEGKRVVRIKSGLGTRRFVYDLHEQLVRAD